MRKNTRPTRRSPGLESLEERALLSGFFRPGLPLPLPLAAPFVPPAAPSHLVVVEYGGSQHPTGLHAFGMMAPHSHDGGPQPDRGPDGPGADQPPQMEPRLDRAMPPPPAETAAPDAAVPTPGHDRPRGDAAAPPVPVVAAPAPAVSLPVVTERSEPAAVALNGPAGESLATRAAGVVNVLVRAVEIHAALPGGPSVDSTTPAAPVGAGEGPVVAPESRQPEGVASKVDTPAEAPVEAPAPRGSGLIAEVLPFDPTTIEQSVARFLEQFEPLAGPVESPPSAVPNPLLVVAAAASFEASRRWVVRRRKGDELVTERERGLAFHGFS
jgi:hypothetical protein